MNATIQDTLLEVFQQVSEDPDRIAAVPVDAWPEGSEERKLMMCFRTMLERVQQNKRQAEEQLRFLLAQYRSIFEETTDGLSISNLDGFIVEANPAACRMFGYSREELLSLHPNALLHPDSQHLAAEVIHTVQAGGASQNRAVCLRKDGTPFLIEAHVTPFLYQGQPHLLSVIHDITERVQAEEQLREREEQYRSIFEATTDALTIARLEDGQIVEANPAACAMLGYTYEEMIGLTPDAVVPPDYLPTVAGGLQTLVAGEQNDVVMMALRKDGTPFPVEAHSKQFTYKGMPHFLTVSRDITERMRVEQQLREREEQYRGVFEATFDAMSIYDPEGFFVEVNPATCRMSGYSRDELIGAHANILFPPERHPDVAMVLELLKEGKEYQSYTQCLRKDGTLIYAEAHGIAFTYGGKPHGLGVLRDTSEQAQAKRLLEQRVQERTRELSSLLEISHTVASTLQLKPLLGLILDQLKTVVDYTGASILTLEGEELVFLDSRSPVPGEQLMQLRFPLKNLRLLWKKITSRESIIMQDVREDRPLARAFRVAMGKLLETTFRYVRACMFVPLVLREQVIGMLVLASSKEGAFTQHHATLALAIANQAAVAIENARLYAQAQELAAIEERQRLARELHDSVSQALYGISLGAHTARKALERDPRQVTEPLDYVLTLAEAALAEMRALIFELRPESMEVEGLVVALSKQAAAMRARHELAVSLEVCDEPVLPLLVKQELYRVAQEALHNIVKHAHASQVDLRLEQTRDAVRLEVRDDGIGFDMAASFPGHLGLHSMRERVENLGGIFQIESTLGAGTRLCVEVPVSRKTAPLTA